MTSRMKDEDGDDDVIDVKKMKSETNKGKDLKLAWKKNLTQKKKKGGDQIKPHFEVCQTFISSMLDVYLLKFTSKKIHCLNR